MRSLTYRPTALANLDSILTFIAQDNIERALSFTEQLRQQCRKLAALPGTLGRARPELHPDIRSFAHQGYVIFFRYRADTLEVVAILEGHRDIVTHFRNNTAI